MSGFLSWLWGGVFERKGQMTNDIQPSTTNKVYGDVTRRLHTEYCKLSAGVDLLPVTLLQAAFNKLHIFPSKSQVHCLQQCATEYGTHSGENHIAFGEFCVMWDELDGLFKKGRNVLLPPPVSLIKSESVTSTDTEDNGRKSYPQVFLGGSCNPTTWRSDTAVPFLKQYGITLYNPQVNVWRPELMQLEDEAKEAADVLFFVIDNETRAVASSVECGYLLGKRKELILILQDFESDQETADSICGEVISERERRDLQRGRDVLVDLAERNAVPVFENVKKGLLFTKLLFEEGLSVRELSQKYSICPVICGHVVVGNSFLKLREIFNSMASSSSGKLTCSDICLAYRSYMGVDLDKHWLERVTDGSSGLFSFEEFCCLVTEYKRKRPSIFSQLRSLFVAIFQTFIGWFKQDSGLNGISNCDIKDVHLGGSCGSSRWRDNAAISLLRKHGITYENPVVSGWYKRLMPEQAKRRERCRILLYYIGSTTRALAAMIEVAYYIGLGCRVVLCIENIEEENKIDDEELTSVALKDYNRGRAYLCDIADREGVPVFEDITEAVQYVIKFVKKKPT